MVKRQKDKQYQSAREHRANQALRSGSGSLHAPATRPLPFDCCALTLTPYATPVCTPDGILFDSASLLPHVMRHKADPVTGAAMTSRDVVALHMDRDEETGQWQCPVLSKPFTNRSKVVAIRQRPPGNEANVFSYEAYHELNVKAKNKVDLISGKKFGPEDVIVLNDPNDATLCRMRDIQNFNHIKLQRAENTRQHNAVGATNVTHSVTASRIMDKLDREKRKRERAAEEQARQLLRTDAETPTSSGREEPAVQIYTDELLTAVHLTSGKASGSLTSTAMDVTRENAARPATAEEILASQCAQLQRLKKKGMVRMFTNRGALDIEVHCDIVPRTAMNFLLLCARGEYDGSKFHRSIANFMLQGGKKPGPKGNEGGSSAWGAPFADEFDDRLTHAGGGVVAMANSGPGTNGRQFYVTYKSCAHLDRKHSVFGKVAGGLDVLRRLEQVPTDKDTDRPLERLRIESMEILENPVTEALELERERVRNKKEEKRAAERARRSSAAVRPRRAPAPGASDDGAKESGAKESGVKESGPPPAAIGKYLKVAKKDKKRTRHGKGGADAGDGAHAAASGDAVSRLPPPPKTTTFGDFSGW